jgi:hypothetical protein
MVDANHKDIFLLVRDFIEYRQPDMMKKAKKERTINNVFYEGNKAYSYQDKSIKPIALTILSGRDVEGKPVYPAPDIGDILQMGLRLWRSQDTKILEKPSITSRPPPCITTPIYAKQRRI